MSIQLIIDPTGRNNAPVYTPDTASDLVAWYQSALAQGQTSVPTAECSDALPANVATVVLRAILGTNPTQDVTLICRDEAEAKVYGQMFNFWFAGTKEERIEISHT